MNENEILSKVQNIEKDILNEVVRICEDYNITYFLSYGTLLGAERHSDFIPWDDDIDISMFRKDYENFITICKKELSEEFFLQDISTDENYTDGNIHIRKKGTTYLMKGQEKYHYKCNGVWLDIWPLDNIKENESVLRWVLVKVLDKLLLYKTISFKEQSIKGKFVFILLLLIKKDLLIGLRKKIINKYNGINTEYVINFHGKYSFEKEKTPKKFYSSTIKKKFGIKYYTSPSQAHKILEKLYGNYLLIPDDMDAKIYHKPQIIEL